MKRGEKGREPFQRDVGVLDIGVRQTSDDHCTAVLVSKI